jgi:hypothetical protein
LRGERAVETPPLATRTGFATADAHQFAAGLAQLAQAEEVVRELHEGCCQPLRSPRMEALSLTIRSARQALAELDGDERAASAVIDLLEDAGAQLGHLQVACCTPARTTLYTRALECLGTTQRLIKRTFDLDH